MERLKVFKPMQRLRRLLAVDKKEITQVYIYALLNGLVNLSVPLGIQAIINLIQGGELTTSWLILVVFVLVGITLTGIFQLMQLRIVENISQKIFSRATFEFAYRIPRIKNIEFRKYYAPELANRFFDTITIQKGLSKLLIDFSLAAFQIVAGLVVLSLYHSFFIIFSVALVALVYTILVITGPLGVKTSLVESKYKYEAAHWLEEVARTKTTFKLINDPEIALTKTDERVASYIDARESHFKILIRQFLSLIGFKVLVAAGLLLIGGILVIRQEMNIGQFVAAEIIIILIINSAEKLIGSLDSIYDVLTALEKIGAVTDMELESEEGLCYDDSLTEMAVIADRVSFAFSDSRREIIKQISFEKKANESLVITGASGAGKSTLMSLISGINDPTDGVIRFNGLSLQSINKNSIRKHIGYALSNNQIFQGSLLDNLTMGREDISVRMIADALRMVNLGDYLNGLPLGLKTQLDPEGMRIPRSVMNKLILARAIVTKPRLLLLEDPLDHVSTSEKEDIMKKLIAPENPWTIIITTVDLNWTKHIEHVVEMSDGEVIFDSYKKEN